MDIDVVIVQGDHELARSLAFEGDCGHFNSFDSRQLITSRQQLDRRTLLRRTPITRDHVHSKVKLRPKTGMPRLAA